MEKSTWQGTDGLKDSHTQRSAPAKVVAISLSSNCDLTVTSPKLGLHGGGSVQVAKTLLRGSGGGVGSTGQSREHCQVTPPTIQSSSDLEAWGCPNTISVRLGGLAVLVIVMLRPQ